MPTLRIDAQEIFLPSKIAFLDTNVLVALFNRDDPNHDHTVEAIDLGEYTWVVLYTVIIESWNFLRGKLEKPREADDLLQWLLTPGNVYIVHELGGELADHRENIGQSRLDFVDAALMRYATYISRALDLRPFAHVATYDLRDFPRCRLNPNFSFHVYDMRELSSTAEF